MHEHKWVMKRRIKNLAKFKCEICGHPQIRWLSEEELKKYG